MMVEFKSALASRGVWGGGIAVLAGVVGFLGYTISAADQRSIIDLIENAAALIGGALAIYGRIRATKRIG